MKTISIEELNSHKDEVLRDVAKGESYILSHEGQPAAILEPISVQSDNPKLRDDPFLGIGKRAQPSPHGQTDVKHHDDILYGKK